MLLLAFRSVRKGPPVAAAPRRTFYHLYGDIAWYGLLAGSSLAFASIYITRLGATAWQIGMLNAGPALVGLLFTLPAGRWLQARPIGKAVFATAILHRLPYLLWFLLPVLVAPPGQIWSYIVLTLLMTIPGTALSVGFNALYASAVPPDERGRVAGIRNAMLSVVYILTSLASGQILNTLPLETGYTIVFLIGFVGAAGSTVHLWFLRGLRGDEGVDPGQVRAPTGDFARPGSMRFLGISVRSSVALRAFARGTKLLRPEILSTRYGGVVGALFFFHFAQYLPIALFPLLWVQMLHLNDMQISLGTATFHSMVLLGSLQLGRLTYRKGNLWIMVAGIVGLSLYPLVNALATGLAFYIVASIIGGLAWSMVGGALANYLLDLAPVNDRPAYLAWYNMALNAGILLGSLAGPILGNTIGIREALLVGFTLRLAAGVLLWFVGRGAHAAHLHPAQGEPLAQA